MRVTISASAERDLADIYANYAARNPNSAGRVVGTIYSAANALERFPLMGREGVVPGTRERIVRRYPYKIIYIVHEDEIEVVRIIHTARQWT